MKTRHRAKGISIIELTITLALGAMLAGGSFLWYSSQRGSQFYDGARQIESQIKEVQSGIDANEVPDGSIIPTPNITTRIGHTVFATSVSVNGTDSASANPTLARQFTVRHYTAQYNMDTGRITTVANGSPYVVRQVTLPIGIVYRGMRRLPSAAGVPCADLNNWSSSNPAGAALVEGAASINTITFRREPKALNYFAGSGVDSTYAAWGGDNPAPGAAASIPCGVMWEFWSQEMVGGNPRFRAEVVYNFASSSYRLVTH